MLRDLLVDRTHVLFVDLCLLIRLNDIRRPVIRNTTKRLVIHKPTKFFLRKYSTLMNKEPSWLVLCASGCKRCTYHCLRKTCTALGNFSVFTVKTGHCFDDVLAAESRTL